MTPDLICAIILLSLFLVTTWLVDIDWDEYRKANSGEKPKGNQVNNREFKLYSVNPFHFFEKINFRMYQQASMVDVILQKENTVNSWARRSGKDTLIAACAIHTAIFKPYSTIVIYVPKMFSVQFMQYTIKEVLAKISLQSETIIVKNNSIQINNSKIIIKSIGSKKESSKPDTVFFNECDNELEIQECIDVEKHEDTKFHVFGTYSIILDKSYNAKYTKVSWIDFLQVDEATILRNQIGRDSFKKEFD